MEISFVPCRMLVKRGRIYLLTNVGGKYSNKCVFFHQEIKKTEHKMCKFQKWKEREKMIIIQKYLSIHGNHITIIAYNKIPLTKSNKKNIYIIRDYSTDST